MDRPRQICVEGPPGVGKTALAERLAQELKAKLVLDAANPFADAANPTRAAFQAQVYTLLARFPQLEQFRQTELFMRHTVADYLFACDRLHAQARLGRDELAMYDKVWQLLARELPRPDLVIYLQAKSEVLVTRLRRAGRPVPPRDHLERTAEAYASFFFHYADSPLLVVNTSEIDFVENRADWHDLTAVIQRTMKAKGAGVHHYNPLGST